MNHYGHTKAELHQHRQARIPRAVLYGLHVEYDHGCSEMQIDDHMHSYILRVLRDESNERRELPHYDEV
jgi:hypothetical protein